jgi:hypothetical protein
MQYDVLVKLHAQRWCDTCMDELEAQAAWPADHCLRCT